MTVTLRKTSDFQSIPEHAFHLKSWLVQAYDSRMQADQTLFGAFTHSPLQITE